MMDWDALEKMCMTCTACGHHGFCVETWEGK